MAIAGTRHEDDQGRHHKPGGPPVKETRNCFMRTLASAPCMPIQYAGSSSLHLRGWRTLVRTIDGLAVSPISVATQPRRSAPSAPYLEKLNDAQRAAVEHGVGKGAGTCGPLHVIAGAGSGKTNTLAHRVAHLLVNGIDPRRVLLLTFSRRAAQDMTRRIARRSQSLVERDVRIAGDAKNDIDAVSRQHAHESGRTIHFQMLLVLLLFRSIGAT